LAIKRVDKFRWKRFKEFWRNLKFPFGQAYRTFSFAAPRQRANFRDRNISLAQKNRFSPRKFRQITGKMGFYLVYVQPYHEFTCSLTRELSQNLTLDDTGEARERHVKGHPASVDLIVKSLVHFRSRKEPEILFLTSDL
jgi:hypothetical protein